MGFAGSGWAEEDDVVLGHDEVQGAQMGDQVSFEAAGMLEVELLQRFPGWETGRPNAALTAVGLSGGNLALQTGHQEFLMSPGLRAGSLGQSGDGLTHRGGLQGPGQVGDLRTQIPVA